MTLPQRSPAQAPARSAALAQRAYPRTAPSGVRLQPGVGPVGQRPMGQRPMGSGPGLFNGDSEKISAGESWSNDGRATLESRSPVPRILGAAITGSAAGDS